MNNGLCCAVACFAGFGDAGRDGDTCDVVEPSFSASLVFFPGLAGVRDAGRDGDTSKVVLPSFSVSLVLGLGRAVLVLAVFLFGDAGRDGDTSDVVEP